MARQDTIRRPAWRIVIRARHEIAGPFLYRWKADEALAQLEAAGEHAARIQVREAGASRFRNLRPEEL